MTQIQFYHLLTTPLDRALPKLLEKVYGAGYKTLLLAGSEEQAEHLNQWLWSYDPASFLPHGSMKDDRPESQPILLSTTLDAPNGASVLLVTNGVQPQQPETFERILDMFDGNDPPSVEQARHRWKNYKDSGHTISYLRQTQSGGWEQKAVT